MRDQAKQKINRPLQAYDDDPESLPEQEQKTLHQSESVGCKEGNILFHLHEPLVRPSPYRHGATKTGGAPLL